MDVAKLLAELCAVPAPSGAEAELADLLHERWAPRCDEVRRDPIGNVIARVGGSGPRVLLQAHMDQVGYVVRHVTDDGFLLLDTAQGDRRTGPERRHPVGQPVRILTRGGSWLDGLLDGLQRPRPDRQAAREARARLQRLLGRARHGQGRAASPPACTSARRSSSPRPPAGSASCWSARRWTTASAWR